MKKDMATFERDGSTRKDEAQFTMATKVLDQLKTGIESTLYD